MSKSCEEETVSTGGATCDEEAREIYIVGEISDDVFQNVLIALRRLDRSKGTIRIILNTNGGTVSSGFGIYDAIRLCKSKVICICMGQCMSIGMAILMACDTRLSSPECRFMVHEPIINFGEMNVGKVELYTKEASFLKSKYCAILAERSSLTLKEVTNLCSKDSFMSPEVVKGYGFLDDILPNVKKPKKKGVK